MATQTIATTDYLLYPSPRNAHKVVFEFQVFVPHPYALIDPPSYDPQGRWSLFAAQRKADARMGQLVTFELDADRQRFESRFVPD